MKKQTNTLAGSLLSSPHQSRDTMTTSSPGVPQRIDADMPAGVHQESLVQAMSPFSSTHHLPGGQVINVAMNAPSHHLPFKEWMLRGVVGGLGQLAAWPFRLVGGLIESLGEALIGILKTLAIVVLLPVMLLVGYKLMQQVSKADSIEAGASQIMHDGRHAATGIGKGLTDELPDEQKTSKPGKKE